MIIGAGSVVTPGKQLESGYLYLGNPARRARALTAEEIARIPKMARDYVLLKREYERAPSVTRAVAQRREHGRRRRPHAAPELERLRRLLDQHAPALRRDGDAVVAAPTA